MSRSRQRSFKKQIKKEKQRKKEIKNQNKKNMRFDKKKEPEEKILLAVYGFLRKDLPNNHELSEGVFIGSFETLPEYTLYDVDGFACLDNEGNFSIKMEIYEVEKSTFWALEWNNNLEGNILDVLNNKELYKLKTIDTPFGNAYVFLSDENVVNFKKEGIIVENGDWLDYHNTKGFNKSLFTLISMTNN